MISPFSMALQIRAVSILLRTAIHTPFLLSCLLFTVVSLRYCFAAGKTQSTCVETLSEGRWSHGPSFELSPSWHPTDCMTHEYSSNDIRICLQNHSLTVIGDSTARQLYNGITNKAAPRNVSQAITKHTDSTLAHIGIQLHFLWDPFLNHTLQLDGTLVVSTGLWQARYLNESVNHYGDAIRSFLSIHTSSHRIVALPVTTPIHERLSKARKETLKPELLGQMNDLLKQHENSSQMEVAWYHQQVTLTRPTSFADDGLHVTDKISAIQANLFLNQECNRILKAGHGRPNVGCCTTQSYEPHQVVAVLAVLCVFILSHGATIYKLIAQRRKYLSENCRALVDVDNTKFLTSIGTLCSALLYCFIADRTQVLPKTNKVVDGALFTIFCLLFAGMGCIRIQRSAVVSGSSHAEILLQGQILSRSQTDEWKGWMQCMILLYHYFGMSQTMWVYRIVRLLVGSYLFLTGFGHTRYFLLTGDFSPSRIISTLLRLNLFSGLLASIMNTTWDFYYFPALVSFWFFVIYVTLIGLSLETHILRSIIRISLSAIFLTYALQRQYIIQAAIDLIFRWGGPQINTSEFLFRLKTDLYAPFSGMLFGLLATKHSDWLLCQYWTSKRNRILLLRINLGVVAALLLTSYFSFSATLDSKQAYNRFHSYASSLPILAYITLRNLTPACRLSHSTIFAWLGRCSLETFILQYHIWLAGDTKGLQHIGILDTPANAHEVLVSWHSWRFWIEKAILTIIFLWLSNQVANAMNVITSTICKKRSNTKINGLKPWLS